VVGLAVDCKEGVAVGTKDEGAVALAVGEAVGDWDGF
jgi:hypothetical protein